MNDSFNGALYGEFNLSPGATVLLGAALLAQFLITATLIYKATKNMRTNCPAFLAFIPILQVIPLIKTASLTVKDQKQWLVTVIILLVASIATISIGLVIDPTKGGIIQPIGMFISLIVSGIMYDALYQPYFRYHILAAIGTMLPIATVIIKCVALYRASNYRKL